LTLTLLGNEDGPFCLDGSQPGYYQRVTKTSENKGKWVIYFSGGGMCLSNEDCHRRATAGNVARHKGESSGGSTGWPKHFEPVTGGVEPMLLRGADMNPDFHSWNHAHFPYCSGDEWLGQAAKKTNPWAELDAAGASDDMRPWGWVDTDRTQLEDTDHEFWFQGHLILEALIKAWTADNAKVTEVVLVGSSSGGLAVYFAADYVKSVLPDARVVAVPTAGWFGAMTDKDDYTNVVGLNPAPLAAPASSKDAWVLHVNTYVPPAVTACKKRNPDKSDHWCWTIRHLYEYMATDLFVADSITDVHKYMQGCTMNCSFGVWGTYGTDLFRFQKAATQAIADSLSEELKKKPNDGHFIISCFTHAIDYSDSPAASHQKLLAERIANTTLQEALHNWYFNASGETRLFDRTALDQTDVLEGESCGRKAADAVTKTRQRGHRDEDADEDAEDLYIARALQKLRQNTTPMPLARVQYIVMSNSFICSFDFSSFILLI